MAKMKKLLFVIMMCVAVVANAQSWSNDLEKNAKKGDVAAQVAVANAYASGDGVKLDLNERLYSYYSKELEGLAEKGHMEAQVAIGDHYLYANRVKKSTSDAAKWYNRATFVFCIPAMIINDAKYM